MKTIVWGELAARNRRNPYECYFPSYENPDERKVRELREQLQRIEDEERRQRNKGWNDQEAERLRKEIRKKGRAPVA